MGEERGSQIKILIVDDDKIIADILKDLISDEEKSVDVCYDGSAAIERIQRTLYDLIIVDLVMPKVGGLEVLKCAKKSNPDVIVIIITGYASLDTAIMAIREGAHDYIRKPCKLEEIKIVVENAVDTIRLYKENRYLLKRLQDACNELMALKNEKNKDKTIASINFFSSNMPSLHYLYNTTSSPENYIDTIRALSSLRENGALTENEFKEFKRHLMKSISLKG